MAKRARPGHVTLTLEIPIEVAEWLSANAELLGHQAHVAATKARRVSEQSKRENKKRLEQRQSHFENLGRYGYRELRKAGVHRNFTQNRDVTKKVAPQLGVSWQVLEFAVTRFKRHLHVQLRKRREREITRMYWAGAGNQEIAARLKIHPSTVTNYIRKVIKPTGRRA